MAQTETTIQPEFYSPWPKFGKPFSRQLNESRQNFESLHPIVRAHGFDPDYTNVAGAAVQSIEVGEQGFHNKYRIFWDDTNTTFRVQKNIGTSGAPSWDDVITVSSSGTIAGNFYPPSGNIPSSGVTDHGALTGLDPDDDHTQYLLASSAGSRALFTLNWTDLTDGGQTTLHTHPTAAAAGDGFYGINVKQTDNLAHFKGINTINFEAAAFYVEQNATNTDEVTVSFRGTAGATAVDQTSASNLGAGAGVFAQEVDNDLQFKSLVAGTNVTLSSDANTITINSSASDGSISRSGIGFYVHFQHAANVEWAVNHRLNSTPVLVQVYDLNYRLVQPDEVDTSDPNNAWFYFSQAIAGRAVIGAAGLNVNPGFYGINVKQSDNAESFNGINTLVFDSTYFYFNQNAGNTDEVLVSLKPPASVVDHGNLSGLADDDHPQYALTDGSRDITGHQDFLDTIRIENKVTAEAFYVAAGGELSFRRLEVNATGTLKAFIVDGPNAQALHRTGTAGSPSISFIDDTDTGVFSTGANEIDISAGSTNVLQLAQAVITANVPINFTPGSASAPGLAIDLDEDTGIYQAAIDTLGVSAGGLERMVIGRDGVRINDKCEAEAFYATGAEMSNSTVIAAAGRFVSGNVSITEVAQSANNGLAPGVIAGNQTRAAGSTSNIRLDANSTVYTPSGCFVNTFTGAAGQTAQVNLDSFGGGFCAGSATVFSGGPAQIIGRNFGGFVGGYAYSGGGATTIYNYGSGSFVWGYPFATAGTAVVRSHSGAQGAFVQGRINKTGGASNANIYGRAAGCFAQGFVYSSSSGLAEIDSTGAATAEGSFSQGAIIASGSSNALLGGGAGARGTFAQGYVASSGSSTANLTATGQGAFAQGFVTGSNAAGAGYITASGNGSFAHGRALGQTLSATNVGAFAAGYAVTNDITATGIGSFAFGDSTSAAISATATNSFQFGPGTNSTTLSLQVGSDFIAKTNGQFAGANDALTLAAAATTFATTSNVMTITGDGGGNTIATITGGINGQHLTLIFADANVTITDDATAAANTVNLSAAFTSTANDVMMLVFNGTSWREVCRSVN